jgi:ribonucleoside-diphosphate reductase alpha chain
MNLKRPKWMTDVGEALLSRGYLLNGEDIKSACERICEAAAARLGKPELANKFFDYSYNKGWLCFSSPVWSNMGTKRGLPISCYSFSVPDSLDGIYKSYHEAGMLTKGGGGLGSDWSSIRPRGAVITNNGSSGGVVPWLKVFDSMIVSTSQGSTRRGAAAAYLDIEHQDYDEFINIRKPKGDPNRQCLNLHQGVVISDAFMEKCKAGDRESLEKWFKLMDTRLMSGEPYLMFKDSAQRQDPECYKANKLSTKVSNLCNEIYLHTDEDHTFVCCLSSMNISKWNEWKDTDAVQTAIWFLDGVMSEFIAKAKNKPGFERSVRSAEKSRALGLGWLGWHTLLQKNMMEFEGLQSKFLNRQIAKHIKEESDKATKALAIEYGEPEWCKGFGVRNTHRCAIAPTASNSIISGQVSPGIEPIAANIFGQNTAKGNFIVKNKILEDLLKAKNKNTNEVWTSINGNNGSVQHLDFLSEHEKEVFKTARELNQYELVRLAAERQPYIDQGQSLNLFFTYPTPEAKSKDPSLELKAAEYVHGVHKLAWELGLKGLYYCRSEGAAKGDIKIRNSEDCVACDG